MLREGCQSSRLVENLRIKPIEWLKVIKVKTEQRANNYEKCLKEGVFNEENRTVGHSFTSCVFPMNNKNVG